ncbi:hypothetical protein GCM10008171_22230 [Methylopila jiangsuensis]|uniref:EAL domain-containing protein n=1 Tax=Methylopila jiangsuensis TaxID=586230 RepID=A0A9W6JJQ5_9HYPH|nr:EAL domain-containing protein [Methylopila jiangsuensis]MDR6286688.1 cyclic-di-GMP phosphodiesterase TipF (flagellum assembly factor) [Methylopila jiangsuensis]GLK76969.1 hypothetical protein GCM10008171_22230 [Methylopila jiangsuensis]
MAVTAVCVGVIAAFGLGLGAAESTLAAVATLALMTVAHVTLLRPPGADEARLDDLDGLATHLQSRVETLDVRLSTLDAAVLERSRAAARPLVDEISALGQLVTSLAKELASHEATLSALQDRLDAAPAGGMAVSASRAAAGAPQESAPPPAPADPTPSDPQAQTSGPEGESVEADGDAQERRRRRERRAAQRLAQVAETRTSTEKQQAPEAFDPLDAAEPEPVAPAVQVDRGVAARVELALRDDRVDFFLQPVVSLPNRRVTHYEGLSRLREPDGIALPEEFLDVAAAEGHLPEIDRRAVMRGLRVAERLQASGRNIGLFINVAPQTLGDDRALSEFVERIDANPDLARAVTLELKQEAFDGLALAEREARKALSERGVRFSIDHVTDLRLDPRDLERRGVRFVKIAASTLLASDAARGLAIHPSDLANLLARHGVDLIVTHVEDERIVPELLDHDVKAASGHLFGVPRPVRDDAGDGGRSDEASRRFAPRPLVVRG